MEQVHGALVQVVGKSQGVDKIILFVGLSGAAQEGEHIGFDCSRPGRAVSTLNDRQRLRILIDERDIRHVLTSKVVAFAKMPAGQHTDALASTVGLGDQGSSVVQAQPHRVRRNKLRGNIEQIAGTVTGALWRHHVVDHVDQAGIAVIQVDEPALRETLPLRRQDRADYLAWAVEAFRLTTAGARDATQIHTHMCYAEFGGILQAITDMDADVISLEAARSEMAIVADLARVGYPNEIGPGVWDIHSPRVPSTQEISDRLRAAVAAFPARRLWVNPDCGLKTRDYPEVRAALANLVTATERVRAEL